MNGLDSGRNLLLITLGLIFFLMPLRTVRANQPSSLADLTVRGINRLETSVLNKIRGNLDNTDRNTLETYQSKLNALAGLIRNNPEAPGDESEAFEDLRQDLYDSHWSIREELDDPGMKTVETLGEFREEILDDPEDYSNEELLNQWFRTIGKNESLQRLLEANRSLLTLIDVYGAYTVRSDSTFRSELVVRYIDLVFPSAVKGYLAEPGAESLAGFLYLGSLNLLDRRLDRLGRRPAPVRHVTALLRFHGRVLRETARGTAASDQLEQTLATIRRLGRAYTGGTIRNGDADFLD